MKELKSKLIAIGEKEGIREEIVGKERRPTRWGGGGLDMKKGLGRAENWGWLRKEESRRKRHGSREEANYLFLPSFLSGPLVLLCFWCCFVYL